MSGVNNGRQNCAQSNRMTSAHSASREDYRQAMTLYLLYHRSHLGD